MDVIDIRTKKRLIFSDDSRDRIKKVIHRSGVTDTGAVEDAVEQIEQVICTSLVMAAKEVGIKIAEKVFKTFNQK